MFTPLLMMAKLGKSELVKVACQELMGFSGAFKFWLGHLDSNIEIAHSRNSSLEEKMNQLKLGPEIIIRYGDGSSLARSSYTKYETLQQWIHLARACLS